jgi:hypothetical protein
MPLLAQPLLLQTPAAAHPAAQAMQMVQLAPSLLLLLLKFLAAASAAAAALHGQGRCLQRGGSK